MFEEFHGYAGRDFEAIKTVDEICICEPSSVGHMCKDLGVRTCFGKLYLIVVWEKPP